MFQKRGFMAKESLDKEVKFLLKRIINKHQLLSILFLLLIIFVVLNFLFFISTSLHFLDFSENINSLSKKDISIFYSLALIILTIAIALIAYLELNKIADHQKSEFLLKIDERWTSKEVIEARVIIHHIQLKFIKNGNISKEDLQQKIGEEICNKIRRDDDYTEKYIILLNFLDFLETIGFLCNSDRLDEEDIRELCGNSIVYFYEIFCPLIKIRRDEKGDQSFYSQLEKLAGKIKNSLLMKKTRN